MKPNEQLLRDHFRTFDTTIDEFNKTLARLLPSSSAVVAYISAMDGFGTRHSDVDVYAVGSSSARENQRIDLGDLELDVELWPESRLVAAAS